MFFTVKGATVDYIDNVESQGLASIPRQNDDMTREEFLKAMTPEQRKQLEEFKKENASAVAANKTVANLNNLLTQRARRAESRQVRRSRNRHAAGHDAESPTSRSFGWSTATALLGAKKYDDVAHFVPEGD